MPVIPTLRRLRQEESLEGVIVHESFVLVGLFRDLRCAENLWISIGYLPFVLSPLLEMLNPERLLTYGAHACRHILGVAHRCAGVLSGSCSLLSSTWYPNCFGDINLFL